MIRKLTLVSVMGILLLGGCGDTGDYLGALSKLASNTADPPVGDLTASEIVALSNHAGELASMLGLPAEDAAKIPVLTTPQAQAIVDFMDANGLSSVSDLQTLADEVANGNPNQITIPADLEELMISMGFEMPT